MERASEDDHRLFAEALRAILSADDRIEVVGLAASGEEAVRRANRSMYPQGLTVQSNRQPLSDFSIDNAFEKVVEVYGGYGVRVEDPADLPKALDKALHAVQVEGRQALINLITAGG